MCKVGCISPGGAGGLLVRRKQYISFSLQMLALTFMLGVGVGEGGGEGRRLRLALPEGGFV